MKAFLMYKDHDFDLQQKLPPHAQALTQDLELQTLFNAMALGDKFVFEVAKTSGIVQCKRSGHHTLSPTYPSGLPEKPIHRPGYLHYRGGVNRKREKELFGAY